MLSPRSKEVLEKNLKSKSRKLSFEQKRFPKGKKPKAYCHCIGKKLCSKPRK
jgi:hypothetical protein